jgi:Regulator of ribonuclease activity B
MNNSTQFPDDATGDALRRMWAKGDDLTQSRMIDFCFIFPERRQALAFADLVDDRDSIVCISYYPGRQVWQSVVKLQMVPDYNGIVAIETTLSVKADSVGGEADGWGCMQPRRIKGIEP